MSDEETAEQITSTTKKWRIHWASGASEVIESQTRPVYTQAIRWIEELEESNA